MPAGITFADNENFKRDFIHFFTQLKDEYLANLPLLKQQKLRTRSWLG